MTRTLWVACALLWALPAGAREPVTLTVTSAAFANNGAIPAQYSCDGNKAQPPLQWTAPPPDTKSIAVTVDDPDAPGGSYSHFVAFDLPPDTRSIGGGAPAGGVVGHNSEDRSGFAAICPPSGRHHYHFVVLALDKKLALPASSDARALADAARGHVLGRGELVGTYSKSR